MNSLRGHIMNNWMVTLITPGQDDQQEIEILNSSELKHYDIAAGDTGTVPQQHEGRSNRRTATS